MKVLTVLSSSSLWMTEIWCGVLLHWQRLCRCSESARVQVASAYSFGFLPSRWHSHWRPYSGRYWDYGLPFLDVRGGVEDVESVGLSPGSYPYPLLQCRSPCQVQVRIRTQARHHYSFGPFYVAQRFVVPLSGRSYARQNLLLPRR